MNNTQENNLNINVEEEDTIVNINNDFLLLNRDEGELTSRNESYINSEPTINNRRKNTRKHDIMVDNIKKYNKQNYYINGWDPHNTRIIKYYINFLSYMCLIYHFYYFKLKKIEGYWSWSIIVLSSFSAGLSLFQYHEENKYLELGVKVTITLFTLITTLISAWIKKQNYVERISELGKYSVKLNRLKNNVKAIVEESGKHKMEYNKFNGEYKDEIIEFISTRPLISPYDWKETVYIISKYYPELAAYEFPWNKVENYGSHVMDTYKRLKYNSCWKKFKHFYFCKSKCLCSYSNDGREEARRIMEQDITFYKKLPRYDVDYNPYRRKGEILTDGYDYLGLDDDIYEEELIANEEEL
jgi:hypothetical protein